MKVTQRISTAFVLLSSILVSNAGLAGAPPPVANADGPYTATVGEQILFDGTGSIDNAGFGLIYDWDFGDTTTLFDAGASPMHIYTLPGIYTVSLTVTDVFGISGYDETIADISAIPVPAAIWLFGSGLIGLIGIAWHKKVT